MCWSGWVRWSLPLARGMPCRVVVGAVWSPRCSTTRRPPSSALVVVVFLCSCVVCCANYAASQWPAKGRVQLSWPAKNGQPVIVGESVRVCACVLVSAIGCLGGRGKKPPNPDPPRIIETDVHEKKLFESNRRKMRKTKVKPKVEDSELLWACCCSGC